MTPQTLSHLNLLLCSRGTIPYGEYVGQGIFQIQHSSSLKAAHRTGQRTIYSDTGVALVIPVYEMIPQLRPGDDRWVIAKWTAPDKESWDRQHENAMEWPKHGMFHCFQPLESGKEPNEEWIRWFLDHLEYQSSLTPQQHMEKVIETGEKPRIDYEKQVADITRDHFVNHVPGKRGGDYLAFTEPSTAKSTPNPNQSV